MPLLSDSAARPIPAVTALRFLRGLEDDPASVALRLGAMFIQEYAIAADKLEYEKVEGVKEKEDTAASANC